MSAARGNNREVIVVLLNAGCQELFRICHGENGSQPMLDPLAFLLVVADDNSS
jgi:hypothetical protein